MIEGVKEEETIRKKEYSVDSAVSEPFVVVEVVAGKQVTCCFVLSSAKTFLFAHLHTHTHIHFVASVCWHEWHLMLFLKEHRHIARH